MDVSRRAFLKAQAASAAAAAAGISLPAKAQNIAAGPDVQLKWSKAPCRFCGPGCGVMVGVKEGKVVATHGDMQAEVNRGLNCVKGYFLSKIMYGADRLTTPLMRMKNGRQGWGVPARFVGPGLRRNGPTVEAGAEGERADRGRHLRLGPVDHVRGLRRDQADARRLPLEQPPPQPAPLHGLGGGHVRPHLRHGRADGLLRRFRERG